MRRNLFVVCAAALMGMAYVGLAAAVDPKLDPGTAPAPTFKTLDQIPPTWDQILPGDVRFKPVMGVTAVLDKETGLVWERTPETGQPSSWYIALSTCMSRGLFNRLGWRLPTIQEITSLFEFFPKGPILRLPSGHPFNVDLATPFWTATTVARDPSLAWVGNFASDGNDPFRWLNKSGAGARVWCVRGGRGADEQ